MKKVQNILSSIKFHWILMISYLVILIPAIIINVILSVNIFQKTHTELVSSNQRLVTEIAVNASNEINSIMVQALSIVQDENCIDIASKSGATSQFEEYTDYKRMRSILNKISVKPYINGIYLYTQSGKIYATNTNSGLLNIKENLSPSSWVGSIRPPGATFKFLPIHVPRQLTKGSPVFSITKSIIKPSTRENIGFLLIDINPKIFSKSEQIPFIIVDKDFNVYFDNESNHSPRKITDEIFKEVFSSENGNYVVPDKGRQLMISYSTIPVPGLRVVSYTDYSILSETVWSLVKSVIFLITICSVFSIFLAIVFSLQITKPIKELTLSMSLISKDNFNIRVVPRGAKDVYLLGVGFNNMTSKINNLMEKGYKMELLQKQTEFDALQQQINPHFLYNTLESMGAYADLNDFPQFNGICLTLSKMLRYNIDCKNYYVCLSQELGQISNYYKILSFRFEDAYKIEVNVDEKFLKYTVLRLSIQPIVENSIKHGFRHIQQGGVVTISAYESNNSFAVVITDNGIGIENEKLNEIITGLNGEKGTFSITKGKSSSIGLYNVHNRIKLYFGEDYGITGISSVPGCGTSVTLSFPLKSNSNL